jgi:hypothetical protein
LSDGTFELKGEGDLSYENSLFSILSNGLLVDFSSNFFMSSKLTSLSDEFSFLEVDKFPVRMLTDAEAVF